MKCQKGKGKSQFLLKKELHQKKDKILRINMTEEVEDLYAENYKTLLKETEDDVKK